MQLFFTQAEPDFAPLEPGLVQLTPAERRCLEQAERRGGTPFVLDARGHLDRTLSGFFAAMPEWGCRSPRSRRTYAWQILLAAEFVAEACGRASLLEAVPDDLRAYKLARRGDGPGKVAAATWNLQLAALGLFYEWARSEGLVAGPPWRVRTRRVLVGGRFQTVEVSALYEPVAFEEVVRCLTIDEYAFFRDVGLRGMPAAEAGRGLHTRGRNGFRDAALAELLVTTGMRITETLALFREELPRATRVPGVHAAAVSLARETTKGGKKRDVHVSFRVLRDWVDRYAESDRACAVERGRSAGLYDVPDHLLVTGWEAGALRLGAGRASEPTAFDLLTPEWRGRLVRADGDAVGGPAVLWCDEQGRPLSAAAVAMSFMRACERCNEGGEAERRFGRPMEVSPHTLRHTFAVAKLHRLISLSQHPLQRRSPGAGLDKDAVERQRRVQFDPLNQLRLQLGHSSVETTYKYLTYLEDVREAAFAAVQAWDELLDRDGAARGRA